MKEILYIAWAVPYDKVLHAGGQTLNYYIKGISKENKRVSLAAFCMEDEEALVDTQAAGIDTHLIVKKKSLKDSISNLQSVNSKLNPWHRYCNLFSKKSAGMLIKELERLRETGYSPDTIILEWTESLLMIDDIKRVFPEARYIASEHDVTFQRIQRQAKGGSLYKAIQAGNTFKRELCALKKCDKVVVHNSKDRKLLEESGIDGNKLHEIAAYYHKSALPYKRENNDVVFFGNMTRPENKEAAEWFKSNVMPLLGDIPVHFKIIGKGAQYVDSIDETFSKAMCFVCPMIHGAGIKVKNLEALYSGIPVLTNTVGIEGIPAENGRDYLHCETPEEYANAVREIFEGKAAIDGRDFMERTFDLRESLVRYDKMLNE